MPSNILIVMVCRNCLQQFSRLSAESLWSLLHNGLIQQQQNTGLSKHQQHHSSKKLKQTRTNQKKWQHCCHSVFKKKKFHPFIKGHVACLVGGNVIHFFPLALLELFRILEYQEIDTALTHAQINFFHILYKMWSAHCLDLALLQSYYLLRSFCNVQSYILSQYYQWSAQVLDLYQRLCFSSLLHLSNKRQRTC